MKNKKQLMINIILTLLYAVFTLIIVLHHEIWADEAQVWLLCKNLSVFELFKHLVQEGHPSLFYLMMMPFAKTGCSVIVMQIFCWLFASAAVFLLLQFSTFSKFEKMAIIFSAGFLYFFPVIARSYSMIPVLVFLAAILYKKQKEYPIFYSIILALITNTHIIMFAFSAILSAYFIYDNVLKEKNYEKKSLISAGVTALGLLAVVVQLAATPFGASCAIQYKINSLLNNIIETFSQFFGNSFGFNSPIMYSIASILFFAILVYIFTKSKKLFALAFFSIGFQLFIYITSYSLNIYPTKSFCAFLIIIFCLWQIDRNKFSKILICIFFTLSILNGLKYTILDLFNNYSSAKETAEYIKNNLPEDSVFIPLPEPYAIAVMLYLPDRKFWSGTNTTYIKYMKWSCNRNNSNGSIVFDFKDVKAEHIYFIISVPNPAIEELEKNKIKILFTSRPSMAEGEAFKIIEYIPIK